MNPLVLREIPKDIAATSVSIFPILPTKEELLALIHEEERLRFSPEIQKQYFDVGTDPTNSRDWDGCYWPDAARVGSIIWLFR